VNHEALFIKLIERKIPLSLLDLLYNWLSVNTARVKWNGLLSEVFNLRTGVNQGAVLAPILFAIFLNDVIKKCNSANFGLILVYADDILIVSRSCYNLQKLFDIIQDELRYVNLELNFAKCAWLRVGPRYLKPCALLLTFDGTHIKRVDHLRYLGVVLIEFNNFKCSVDKLKCSFNRACNSILAKLLGRATEDLIVHLVKVKCLPILLYACEVCAYNNATIRSLDFVVVRFGMRIFKSAIANDVITSLSLMGLELPSVVIPRRVNRFVFKLAFCENVLCQSLTPVDLSLIG
jgi:hypothetical protein